MQTFCFTGRLCNNPRLRELSNDGKKVTFTLAIPRRYKRENQPEADFFFCVAFSSQALHIAKYFRKGMKIEGMGEIQTYSYMEDDQKKNSFQLLIRDVGFGDSKEANERYQRQEAEATTDMPIPEDFEHISYMEDGFSSFPGSDAMTECKHCHAVVPDTGICLECGVRM